jgi:hypothetical protein
VPARARIDRSTIADRSLLAVRRTQIGVGDATDQPTRGQGRVGARRKCCHEK